MTYDLVVVGGGSGGVRAARIAAGHGARVAIVEADRWGGTCVIRGCVPKKLLVFASEFGAEWSGAAGLGWQVEPARFDWPTLRERVAAEVTRLSGLYAETLERAGVERLAGRGVLRGAEVVDVDGRRLRARHILLATGGAPRRLVAPGADAPGRVLVSDDLFGLPVLPRHLLVVGAGYVGVEFAHVFAGFGVAVTLAYRHPRPLPGFDDDVRAAIDTGLRQRGVTLRPGAELARLDGDVAVLTDGGPPVPCDRVLAAVGRDPATAGLGLAEAGVAIGRRGEIVVDAEQRTSVPSIYAVGDVTGRVALTPVAIREGHAVADTLFGGRPTQVDHRWVPSAVFAQPPAAHVGLSEAAARAAGHDVVVFRGDFRPMKHVLTGAPGRALFKVVVDRPSDRVLGVHAVCEAAPEIIQAVAIAVTMGATKADLDRTIALHPTLAEELVLLRTPG